MQDQQYIERSNNNVQAVAQVRSGRGREMSLCGLIKVYRYMNNVDK